MKKTVVKRGKRNKNRKIILTILATIILVGSVVFGLAYNQSQQIKSTFSQKELLNKSSSQIQESLKKNKKSPKKNKKYVVSNFDAVNDQDYTGLMNYRKQALKSGLRSDSKGVVRIKDLGISLNIYKNINPWTLAVGAGELNSGQVMGQGNYILAGHNMRTKKILFTNLLNAKKGQIVELINANHAFKYKIVRSKTISPIKGKKKTFRSDLFNPTAKPTVTLFCCINHGHDRYVVQAEMLE